MAKIESDYGKKRTNLKEEIPLEMPFALYISPSHLCNFRCFYCLHSKSMEEKKQLGIKPVLMNLEMADRIAEQANEFGNKFKRIMFSGCGEPLVNNSFPDILNSFVKRGVSEKYELNTNGTLLTPNMIDRILDAGITNIRISIQGLTEKKYKEISNIQMNYVNMINNLKYLRKNKGKCEVYIKIIDACFDNGETEEDFMVFSANCVTVCMWNI